MENLHLKNLDLSKVKKTSSRKQNKINSRKNIFKNNN